LLSITGDSPFRRWEILHIRICLKSVLLGILTWKFWTSVPESWGVILALAEMVATTCVYALSAVLLYTGATDPDGLNREMQRLGPWLRAAAWTSGVLAWLMGGTVALSHPVLAGFLLVLSATLTGSILVLKPAVDRSINALPT
jgi:hypothetical protein